MYKNSQGGIDMKRTQLAYWALAFCAILLWSCGGGSGGGTGASETTGTLSLSLTDASIDDLKAVYVTITEVHVHMPEGPWQVVATPGATYNLLELINGVREELGISELPAGYYSQMRLIIGHTPDEGRNILEQAHPYANYVIDPEDTIHKLFVPSGHETGVKLVHGFFIYEDETTELIFDFSVAESIVVAGRSGKWLLKPTIKVLENFALISGQVKNGDGEGLEGISISAQIYDPDYIDVKDEVSIQTSTVTGENGFYKLFLRPGAYNIVAANTNYLPAVACFLELHAGEDLDGLDFELTSSVIGTVSLQISIEGEDQYQFATISFRQPHDCDADGIDDIVFEIKSANLGDGAQEDVHLPGGTYDMVVSSAGRVTQVIGVIASDVDADIELVVIDLEP
jgi:hypothetical protein